MEDPKSAAERLHQALFDKKNKEETCTDIIINNDLEHRLLIAKKYGELYGNPLYEDMNPNSVDISKSFVVIVS